jgi:hypothetical protein
MLTLFMALHGVRLYKFLAISQSDAGCVLVPLVDLTILK